MVREATTAAARSDAERLKQAAAPKVQEATEAELDLSLADARAEGRLPRDAALSRDENGKATSTVGDLENEIDGERKSADAALECAQLIMPMEG